MSKLIARLMDLILLSCGLHDAFCTRPTVSPCSPQHYRRVVSNSNRGTIAGKLKHTHTHTSVKLQSEGNADRDTVRVKGVVVNIVWPSKFTYLEFWSKPTHSHHGFGFLSNAKKLILASLEYLLFFSHKSPGMRQHILLSLALVQNLFVSSLHVEKYFCLILLDIRPQWRKYSQIKMRVKAFDCSN